jgi:hypothetical protein
VPTGSVTFLDGTTELGTVALRGGKARLMTSGLVPGRDRIEVVYSSGTGMVPSTATVIETVRQARSRSMVISSPRLSRAASGPVSMAPPAGKGPASPTEPLTAVAGPTVLGTFVVDPGATGTGAGPSDRRQSVLHG